MTLKSFVINFSEFPNKFSPIVKNGTVLFFVENEVFPCPLIISRTGPKLSRKTLRSLFTLVFSSRHFVLSALLMLSLN